jgi:hypothetical protein
MREDKLMPRSAPTPLDRRSLLASLATLPAWPNLIGTAAAQAQTGPLASWNDGPARRAILEFVRVTTDHASPGFVPPEERIATFDQDGTLWVEQPAYSQLIYCFDRVPALVKAKPELANVEPFKTVLSGNREAIAKLPMKDLEEIVAATLRGMPMDAFQAEVGAWMRAAFAATRRAIDKCLSTPGPATVHGWRCSCCTTTKGPTAEHEVDAFGFARVFIVQEQVQRASLSFCAFLAGLSSHPSGALPALIASFSSRLLCCLGALTMVASTI